MKTINFLPRILTMVIISVFGLISCEVDESTEEVLNSIETAELTEPDDSLEEIGAKNRAALANQNVRRYYAGGSSTMHTYKVASAGAAIGSYEGIAFSTPVIASGGAYDTNKYNILYFLLHPQNKDFIMTTSATEFWNLKRKGWRNLTYGRPLIQKGAGSGAKKLYRFYGVSNSDHLFTKNYSEGVNAGYQYEGVVGYVN